MNTESHLLMDAWWSTLASLPLLKTLSLEVREFEKYQGDTPFYKGAISLSQIR